MINYTNKIHNSRAFPCGLGQYEVKKPWGKEIWMELNSFYAYKVISMNKGCKSSLQSHTTKIESNFIIKGQVELLIENEAGILCSFILKEGEGWSVPPGKKHRVIAISDYVALEVSSPHLDDVIRYQDDYNRTNGVIHDEHTL